jgi:hypothetical protein
LGFRELFTLLQGDNIMEMLSLDNIKCTKPVHAYGDLHITADGFYFLGFRRVNVWAVGLWANLGLLGVWLMRRADKKRAAEMEGWRARHGESFVDELAVELPDSWVVLQEEIRNLKKSFLGDEVVIEHVDGRKFSLEVKKEQREQILSFAQVNNLQVTSQQASE